MKTTLEYHTTGIQLCVHDSDKVNYLATCEIKVYFNVGVVSAMLGKRLFVSIYANRRDLYEKTGIRYLQGYVYANVAETISRLACARSVSYTLGRHFTDDKGRDTVWIEVDLQNDEVTDG